MRCWMDVGGGVGLVSGRGCVKTEDNQTPEAGNNRTWSEEDGAVGGGGQCQNKANALTLGLTSGLVAVVEDGALPLELEEAVRWRCQWRVSSQRAPKELAQMRANAQRPKQRGALEERGGKLYLHLRHDGRCG